MNFLYHENRSTGSVEEARGHTESMERQQPNALSSWKWKNSKIRNRISQ